MNTSPHAKLLDAVVIGGGAAGLSAALMLGRSLRSVVVVDAGQPRNRFASHMYGVLGHDGLPPLELVNKGRAELAKYGAQIVADQVTLVERDGKQYVLTLASGGVLRARSVVVASGLRDEYPSIEGLTELWGRRVLHCPYCHGWEVRGQRFGVLVTNENGAHQAELVRQWSEAVTVFVECPELLDADVRARLRARGVQIVDAPVARVSEDAAGDLVVSLGEAVGKNAGASANAEYRVDALFVAPRPVPQDEFLAPLALEREQHPWGDFVRVDPMGRTSDPTVWLAGNVVNAMATVTVSMAAGSMAGAGLNGTLVQLDAQQALNEVA